MFKRYRFWISVFVIVLSASAFGQFRAHSLGGGMGFGGALGWSDDGTGLNEKAGLSFRAFLRHSFTDVIEGELSAGFNTRLIGDDNTRTRLTPLDARMLVRPFVQEFWSPYFYAGIGALRYHIDEFSSRAAANAATDGWAPYVPVGLGLQFRMNDFTSLEFSGGYNYAFSDDLNAIESASANDGFFTAQAGLTMSGFNWNGDPDGDGLSNREEKKLGTDMRSADTDGDGLNDGEEFYQYKTNPLLADSDGDGLNDMAEAKTHKTNPNKADTDDDGLKDQEEVLTYHTDPLQADTDGDGLSDKEELLTYKSDPLRSDMDDDGLSDGQEVTQYKTDFAKADTDGDGLTDGDEVLKYGTDPLNADSDAGSVSDGAEIARGTNPLSKEDDVILEVSEVGQKIVLEGIVFPAGSARITPESAEILEKAYQTLAAYPDMTVEILGYTDNTGSRVVNMRLSEARAKAVKNYLVQKGIAADRIIAKGLGPSNPIASNSTSEGRRKNRRIEFVRVK